MFSQALMKINMFCHIVTFCFAKKYCYVQFDQHAIIGIDMFCRLVTTMFCQLVTILPSFSSLILLIQMGHFSR